MSLWMPYGLHGCMPWSDPMKGTGQLCGLRVSLIAGFCAEGWSSRQAC
jgi:hypothetical protein